MEKVQKEEKWYLRAIEKMKKQGFGAFLKMTAYGLYIPCRIMGLDTDRYYGALVMNLLVIVITIIDASINWQLLRVGIGVACFFTLLSSYVVGAITSDGVVLQNIITISLWVTIVLSFLDSVIPWKSKKQKEENDLQCNSNILEVKGVLENATDFSSNKQVLTLQLPLEDLKCILHGKCENCKVKEKSTEKTSKMKYVFKKNQNASFYITMENTISSNGEITLPGTNDSLSKEEKTNE